MHLKLYEIFQTDVLKDRETAQQIGAMIPNEHPAIIDFENICFASRAFCHELYIQLKNKEYELAHMNKNVRAMVVSIIFTKRAMLKAIWNTKSWAYVRAFLHSLLPL